MRNGEIAADSGSSDYMTSRILEQDIDTAEGIEEIVSLLMAAQPYIDKNSPEEYLNKKVEEAADNLTTREIAEKILSGTENFSFIMDVWPLSESTPNGKTRYAWKTNYESHRELLDQIRRDANVMHEKISVTLITRDNYTQIVSIATALKNEKKLYDSWEEIVKLKKYDSWEEIVKLKKKEIKAAEPAMLAYAFYKLALGGLENIKEDANEGIVRRGISALMYMKQEFPKEKRIIDYLTDLAGKYQNSLPDGAEFKTLHKQLTEIKTLS